MKLVKRLIELAFGIFLLSLFALNSDVRVQIQYYGLTEPITVRFFELVLFCVALGVILAAVGDFITQLKWISERRRLLKRDQEHQSEVDLLNNRIKELEDENARYARDIEQLQRKAEKNDVKPAEAPPAKEPEILEKPAQPTTTG